MIDNFKFFHLENIFQKYCTYSHKIIRLQKPTIHQKSNSNPDVKPIREIWKSKSRNLVTGKCTSAEVGGRNTEDCFAFLASIKDHRDCGTTYGHLLSTGAPLARTHTRAHTFSLDLDSTPSAFLTATRLLSKPIPRVGPRGSGHPPTFYRLLDTLRRRITSSLSFSRYRSHFLSLALAVVLFLSLSLSLSRHTDTKWIYVRAHRSISRRLFSKPLAEDVWKISRMILDE